MKIRNKIIALLVILGISMSFSSCVKHEFDAPPCSCDSINITATYSIQQVKDMLVGDTTRLDSTVIICGNVTSSDLYGNIYKELYIQDTSAGISIQIDAKYMYETYPLGQKIYVKCDGLYVGDDDGVIKLGGTFVDAGQTKFGRIVGDDVIAEHLLKTCDVNIVEPQTIKISDVNDNLMCKFVKFENVQFTDNDLGSTWAVGGSSPASVNHNLIDADGNKLIVRSSGYASFVRDSLPKGSGSITGVLGKYGADFQLYIINTDGVDMNKDRF